MKLTKILKITVKAETLKDCEEFFKEIKSFCDTEMEELGKCSCGGELEYHVTSYRCGVEEHSSYCKKCDVVNKEGEE